MKQRRRFNRAEHIALDAVAGGHCERCGAALEPGWHADHVVPYAAGGATDMVNAAALCPRCNLAKGGSMRDLRPWQREALTKYRLHSERDFLLVATPGAGKTRVAAEIVAARQADLTVIAVPTVALCEQWADALDEVGIKARPNWDGTALPSDVRAVTITYAALGMRLLPAAIRALCGRCRVFAILDEIHHLSESRAWGEGARYAFDAATARLGLSGTPFRTDEHAIPFVRYVEGHGQADYLYGYGSALGDTAVRSVYFPAHGGLVEWITPHGEHRIAEHTNDVREAELAQHLRARIDPAGEFMGTRLLEAHARLTELRASDPDAGGLIVADHNEHADALAARHSSLIGVPISVVHSDVENPRAVIDRFRHSSEPWLVAVKMVAEGIDIPRLRVGVFAATTTSELFFRQVVGRFVRVEPEHDDQSATVFIPDHPELLEWARSIKEDRDAVLAEQLERELERDRDGDERPDDAFAPLATSAELTEVVIPGALPATPDEWAAVEFYRERHEQTRGMDPVQVLLLMRAMRDSSPPAGSGESRAPQHRVVADVRRLNHDMANRIAARHGIENAHVNSALNRAVDARGVSTCSSEQLVRRLEIARRAFADPSEIGL